MAWRVALLGVCVVGAAACGSVDPATSTGDSTSGPGGATSSTSGAGGSDPAPTFTDREWALLKSLSPDALPGAPVDVSNAYADDAAAAALGQRLFFSTVFSGALLDSDDNGDPGTLGQKGETGKVACASCHVPDDAFSDGRSPSHQISLASGWGRRRAPSLLDVGQETLVMWDGRHDALYNQVFGPFESAVEMNSSRLFVAEQVFAHFKEEYEAVFGPMPSLDDAARFPILAAEDAGCPGLEGQGQGYCTAAAMRGSPGDGAEFDGLATSPTNDQEAVTRVVVNVGKAIAAYERLLSCGPGPFDRFVHGDDTALTSTEKRGAQVFIGKGGCVTCHDGPFLTDRAFHNVGLAPATVASAFIDSDDHGALEGLAAALADPLNTEGVFSDGRDGRLPDAVGDALDGAFRTPGLRCVSKRPSFMHTGQLLSLDSVVELFDQGGHVGGFFGTNELEKLGLSDGEKSDLVSFLKTLDGPGPDVSLTTPP